MADSPDRWELVRPNRTATLDDVGRRWELRKAGEYDEHTNEDRKRGREKAEYFKERRKEGGEGGRGGEERGDQKKGEVEVGGEEEEEEERMKRE